MSVSRWDPFRELHTLQDRMNRLFEEASRREGDHGEAGAAAGWSPAVDVYEAENEIVVTAELPGIERDQITLSLQENILTLHGVRDFERAKGGNRYHRIERSYGSFSRTFTIPAIVNEDTIQADFKDGVLTIVLPKVESGAARQIRIRN